MTKRLDARILFAPWLTVAAISTAPMVALAMPTWQYGGTTNSIYGGNSLPMEDYFSLNDPVQVTVAIDPSQADTCADEVYGCYAIGPIHARFGSNIFVFDSGTLVVRNDYNDLQDTFSIRATTLSDLFGTPLTLDFELSGVDFSKTALKSDKLPVNVNAIAGFSSRDTKLIFFGESSQTVQASVDTWRNIPEPSSYVLALIALALLGCSRSERRKVSGARVVRVSVCEAGMRLVHGGGCGLRRTTAAVDKSVQHVTRGSV